MIHDTATTTFWGAIHPPPAPSEVGEFRSFWLNSQSLRILERLRESEKPMSLVNLHTDSQDWVNIPLAQMLSTSPQEATQLNMRDYWEEDALAYVKRVLQQQSSFNHNYEAFIPAGRCNFSSTFEVVQFGYPVTDYRLVTIHQWELLTSGVRAN